MEKPSKKRFQKKMKNGGPPYSNPGDPQPQEDYLNQQDTYRHPTERQQKEACLHVSHTIRQVNSRRSPPEAQE